MLMRRIVNRVLFILCAVGLLTGAAQADDFSYRLGRQLGQQTTASAWLSISRTRGCDAADDLVDVITRSARRIGQTARRYQKRDMVDYAEGYIHGLRAALSDIAMKCTDKCANIGEAAGSASAVVFCEIAQLIGEVPVFIRQQDAPNITCGEPYRIQCEINFETITKHDCPNFTNGPPPAKQNYEHYYLSSEGGACAYNPPRP
jgi:hypothetical protein